MTACSVNRPDCGSATAILTVAGTPRPLCDRCADQALDDIETARRPTVVFLAQLEGG